MRGHYLLLLLHKFYITTFTILRYKLAIITIIFYYYKIKDFQVYKEFTIIENTNNIRFNYSHFKKGIY